MGGKYLKIPWKGLFAVSGTVIFGSLAADAIQGSCLGNNWMLAYGYTPELWFQWVSMLLSGTLFFCFLIALYNHRSDFQSVRSLRQQVCGRAYQGVIFLLSPPDRDDVSFTSDPFSVKVGDVMLSSGDLDIDINRLQGTRWPWQQLMRGLKPHAEKLKCVYLIGSTGEKGSHVSLGFAAKFIKVYLENVLIEIHPEAVDFEKFDQLRSAIEQGAHMMTAGEFRIDEEDVIIDVTGGFKTASIAGAVVTLNRSLAFQYVQTYAPFDVIEYDLEIRSPVSA